MRPRVILVLLLGVVALAAAACGGGGGSGTTDFFDTGIIDTGGFEQPPPPAETAQPPAQPLQIKVPPAGQPIGPQSPVERIAELQRALVALGYKIGKADGIYGKKTRNAVVKFQKKHKLASDGLVGPKTAKTINKELAKRGATG